MANQLPVNQVLQMRQQGYSDNQIVQHLQGQGFTSQQVYDAMSQADFSKLSGAPVAPGQPPQQAAPAEMPPPPEPAPAPEPYAQYPAPEIDEEKISEIAEAIINEKWEEIIPEIKGIAEWKEKIESRLQKIIDDFKSLKEQFNELHKGILSKISEYDEHIRDVGSELKAVEKVFKDVIPSFTQNVSELSRITKTLKKK